MTAALVSGRHESAPEVALDGTAIFDLNPKSRPPIGQFGPDTQEPTCPGVLETTLPELADLLRKCGEVQQADTLERTMQSIPDEIPRRVLELFTHGMGGLFDAALYKDRELEREATERLGHSAQ